MDSPSLHLTRDDSATIAFVIECLFTQAITVGELRDWADHVLDSVSDPPDYVVELSLFDGYPKDIYSVVGFTPDRELGADERLALVAIAHARGRDPQETRASRERAAAALARQPHVRLEFERTFPFLR